MIAGYFGGGTRAAALGGDPVRRLGDRRRHSDRRSSASRRWSSGCSRAPAGAVSIPTRKCALRRGRARREPRHGGADLQLHAVCHPNRPPVLVSRRCPAGDRDAHRDGAEHVAARLGDFTPLRRHGLANHAQRGFLARDGDEVHLVAHRVSPDLAGFRTSRSRRATPVRRPSARRAVLRSRRDASDAAWPRSVRTVVNGGNADLGDVTGFITCTRRTSRWRRPSQPLAASLGNIGDTSPQSARRSRARDSSSATASGLQPIRAAAGVADRTQGHRLRNRSGRVPPVDAAERERRAPRARPSARSPAGRAVRRRARRSAQGLRHACSTRGRRSPPHRAGTSICWSRARAPSSTRGRRGRARAGGADALPGFPARYGVRARGRRRARSSRAATRPMGSGSTKRSAAACPPL